MVNQNVFRDAEGCQGQFEAISVIDFAGRLSSTGESGGHYTCDIKESKSNKWFRTNDSRLPIQIEEAQVSKTGYVVLFKRVNND